MAFNHLLALELQGMALGWSSDVQGCLQSRDGLPLGYRVNTSRKDAESSQLHHVFIVLCWSDSQAAGSILVLLPSCNGPVPLSCKQKTLQPLALSVDYSRLAWCLGLE